jgi:hypothetical protein
MRDILTSPGIVRIKHNRRARRLRSIIALLIIFISLIGSVAYYSSNSHITINKIVVTSNITINTSDIESLVKKDISGRYLYLFSRANALLYPKEKIYNDLTTVFPRIEALSIYREGWNILHIAITERSGSFLYCGEKIPETKEDIGENCYFINNNGYIFDKAPYFSGNIYFKYYLKINDNNGNPIGDQMLQPENFHNISSFIDGVSKMGFKPIYILADENGDYHLYLDHNLSDTSPEIIFKSNNNLPTVLNNLSAAMTKQEFTNEINSKYDKLLYIDLRFNNKVLYKFNE